jgi:putative ATP-dependent endonuclease of OLD family
MLLRNVDIENFRGFEKVSVDLDRMTVLIGENNSGKTSFIDALRLCLERSLSRRATAFDDYDHYLPSKDSQPSDSPKLAVTLDFAEEKPDEWPDELVQALGDVAVFHGALRHVTLRVTSDFDRAARDFTTDWEFLDSHGNPLPAKTKRPQFLYTLQQLNPLFYLSAIRDAAKEFQPRAALWGKFLRNPSIPADMRKELEDELTDLNRRILSAEPRLDQLQKTLTKAQALVHLAGQDAVSIDAFPAHIWDILSRAQVNIGGSTGASLPLARHGSGTQSLSVILLFEAFLTMMLAQAYDEQSSPILAIEEPEAHLHPCAIRSLWKLLTTLTGQKIIATHSGDLLAEVPLSSIRRFYREGAKIHVRKVDPHTLTPDDARKLQLHLQKTRGELLFAKCWLMAEGATEYWVFTETARLLGIDLECLGIRVVLYSNVGAVPFAKIANDLGIHWHCVCDGDSSGQNTRTSLQPYLHGDPKADRITVLSSATMELFLCENGLGKPYLANIAPQKKAQLTANPGDADYWKQVQICQSRMPKEQLAIEAMMDMRRQGPSAVPHLLTEILTKVTKLAGS